MLTFPTMTPTQARLHQEHKDRQRRNYKCRAPAPRLKKEPAPTVEPKRIWFYITDDFEPRRPSVKDIQRVVAGCYQLTREDLLSRRQDSAATLPRQVAMYLAKTVAHQSHSEIGRRFGGRDHTTVLHAIRKITASMETDLDLREKISLLSAVFTGGKP